MKEISLKDLENLLREAGIPEYPKYLGNGLWKIAENCITGQKGYEEFMKAMNERIKQGL